MGHVGRRMSTYVIVDRLEVNESGRHMQVMDGGKLELRSGIDGLFIGVTRKFDNPFSILDKAF
jgi:hypothetical protein